MASAHKAPPVPIPLLKLVQLAIDILPRDNDDIHMGLSWLLVAAASEEIRDKASTLCLTKAS